MMNAELIAANEERIVIPTVYRPDYVAAQRALSVHGEATPVVRMLDFARSWTLAINWTTVVETEERLQRSNAFLTEQQADTAATRLRIPSPEGSIPEAAGGVPHTSPRGGVGSGPP